MLRTLRARFKKTFGRSLTEPSAAERARKPGGVKRNGLKLRMGAESRRVKPGRRPPPRRSSQPHSPHRGNAHAGRARHAAQRKRRRRRRRARWLPRHVTRRPNRRPTARHRPAGGAAAAGGGEARPQRGQSEAAGPGGAPRRARRRRWRRRSGPGGDRCGERGRGLGKSLEGARGERPGRRSRHVLR